MRRIDCHNAMIFGSVFAIIACGPRLAAQENSRTAPGGSHAVEVATEPAAATMPFAGVVMLQDGGVIEGQITRAADWYIVGRSGGQMQIAASRVLFAGRSLHEAYEYRRQHVTQTTADAHLSLAEWCLRYSLADDAASELETARQLGAGPDRLMLLERRLTATKERLTPKPIEAGATIRQTPATEQPTPPRAVLRDLPDGVLEMFTRKVQPVLVNNCTASKCHQPGGQQSFQLNRALLRGESNRRTTVQNLTATLARVDRAHPESSLLLTVPRQTHGGMTGPVFGPRQEQAFKHLADWVALVAPPKPETEGTTIPAMEKLAGPPMEAPLAKASARAARVPHAKTRPTATDRAAVTQAIDGVDAQPVEDAAVQPAAAIDWDSVDSLHTPHRLRYGVTPEHWQPRDPFDPEIFNRRQHSQSHAQVPQPM